MICNRTGMRDMKREALSLVLCFLFVMGFFPVCLVASSIQLDSYLDSRPLETQRISSETMTRREAIIDYVGALQAPEGYFHAYLTDPPPFDLDHTPATYSPVLDAYYTLRNIDAVDSLDWTETMEFLKSLVNQDTGLLNLSKEDGPDIYTCRAALTFYQDIGADEGIDIDGTANFIAALQQANGGFLAYFGDTHTTILQTYCAIDALRAVHRLYKIDNSKARGFILDCYNEDGGFGRTTDGESDFIILPAALYLVDVLGMWEDIDVDQTLSFILQLWDDNKGCNLSEELTYTYYLAWSLWIMGRTDAINTENLIQWLLSCQHSLHGEFVGYPDAEPDNERLVCAFYATRLLSLYDGLDRLEESINVEESPHWEIPQWWIDYVNENWGTTTTTNHGPSYFIPDLRFLIDALPYIAFFLLACTPAFAITWWVRLRKIERREMKKQRKNMRRG